LFGFIANGMLMKWLIEDQIAGGTSSLNCENTLLLL